jgi:hypothetical protein
MHKNATKCNETLSKWCKNKHGDGASKIIDTLEIYQSAGQLLGFLVSARGIETNPEKIQAILTMGKPAKLHDVQKLTGRVAALSRFVARLGEKALPFYALMKKSDDKFEWTEEADIASVQLKKVFSTPPMLVTLKEKEPLLLYIAATHQVVSMVLVVERSEEGKEHRVQRPIYFLSEVLSPTKQRYPALPEACIQRVHNSTKITEIFRSAPNHSG